MPEINPFSECAEWRARLAGSGVGSLERIAGDKGCSSLFRSEGTAGGAGTYASAGD